MIFSEKCSTQPINNKAFHQRTQLFIQALRDYFSRFSFHFSRLEPIRVLAQKLRTRTMASGGRRSDATCGHRAAHSPLDTRQFWRPFFPLHASNNWVKVTGSTRFTRDQLPPEGLGIVFAHADRETRYTPPPTRHFWEPSARSKHLVAKSTRSYQTLWPSQPAITIYNRLQTSIDYSRNNRKVVNRSCKSSQTVWGTLKLHVGNAPREEQRTCHLQIQCHSAISLSLK